MKWNYYLLYVDCFDEAHIHFIGVLEEKLVLEQALRQHYQKPEFLANFDL